MTRTPLSRRNFIGKVLGASLLAGGGFATACAGTRPVAYRSDDGLPKLLLSHPSGASVEMYLQGAHVTSWRRPDGEDVLFMSRQSRIEYGAAIRGGIPIVFPQFASMGPLPSHGFVRTVPWKVTDRGAGPTGAAYARLQLTDFEASRAIWPHSFRAELLVWLDEALTTTLRVTNTDEQPFTFQSALHTYYRVGDIRQVQVEGLEGIPYLDRTADGARRGGEREPLPIHGPTDRIYMEAPDRLRVRDSALGRSILVEKEGFADAVVWNPWAERSRTIADLGEDEYAIMLCVEPANITTPTFLEPGQVWSGTQRIRVE